MKDKGDCGWRSKGLGFKGLALTASGGRRKIGLRVEVYLMVVLVLAMVLRLKVEERVFLVVVKEWERRFRVG